MSQACQEPTPLISVMDEYGNTRELHITGERPLTLYVDKREIVTLMTLGSHPELLTLGYLRNQGFIRDAAEVRSVQVDWDVEAAAVTTWDGIDGLEERLSRRTVTTGCGQGTIFGSMMEELENIQLPRITLPQSVLYRMLKRLRECNSIYRQSGAVHGCALCKGDEVLVFIEDVGRHNAVDAIAGKMMLDSTEGSDKIFYTTGRLTSEMVIKVAQMGIPVLVSRSGVTQMGLELARNMGVTLIARAGGKHFLVYHGSDSIVMDVELPEKPFTRFSTDTGTTFENTQNAFGRSISAAG